MESEEEELISDCCNKKEPPKTLLFRFRCNVVEVYNNFLPLISLPENSTKVQDALKCMNSFAHSLLTSFSTRDMIAMSDANRFQPQLLTAAESVSTLEFTANNQHHRMHPLDPQSELLDLNAILQCYNKTDVDYLCRKLCGHLLSPVLRQFICNYRCLYKSRVGLELKHDVASVLESNRNTMFVKDLMKQGVLKGVHDILDQCPHSGKINVFKYYTWKILVKYLNRFYFKKCNFVSH